MAAALLLAAAVACSFTGAHAKVLHAAERSVLTQLYHSTQGPHWAYKWDIKTDPCEDAWYGVTCSADGHVKYLQLNNNRLIGKIPTSIGLLRRIEELDMSGNFLTGKLPRETNRLVRIRTLNLSDNALSGEYFDLNKLVRMRYLNLGGNQMTGCIPRALQARGIVMWQEDDPTTCVPGLVTELGATASVGVGGDATTVTLAISATGTFDHIRYRVGQPMNDNGKAGGTAVLTRPTTEGPALHALNLNADPAWAGFGTTYTLYAALADADGWLVSPQKVATVTLAAAAPAGIDALAAVVVPASDGRTVRLTVGASGVFDHYRYSVNKPLNASTGAFAGGTLGAQLLDVVTPGATTDHDIDLTADAAYEGDGRSYKLYVGLVDAQDRLAAAQRVVDVAIAAGVDAAAQVATTIPAQRPDAAPAAPTLRSVRAEVLCPGTVDGTDAGSCDGTETQVLISLDRTVPALQNADARFRHFRFRVNQPLNAAKDGRAGGILAATNPTVFDFATHAEFKPESPGTSYKVWAGLVDARDRLVGAQVVTSVVIGGRVPSPIAPLRDPKLPLEINPETNRRGPQRGCGTPDTGPCPDGWPG